MAVTRVYALVCVVTGGAALLAMAYALVLPIPLAHSWLQLGYMPWLWSYSPRQGCRSYAGARFKLPGCERSSRRHGVARRINTTSWHAYIDCFWPLVHFMSVHVPTKPNASASEVVAASPAMAGMVARVTAMNYCALVINAAIDVVAVVITVVTISLLLSLLLLLESLAVIVDTI